MNKVYERVTNGHADNGTSEILSQKDGLAEINSCMMGDLGRQVLRMSSISRTDYHIVYRNGDVVTLKLVDAPQPPRVDQEDREVTAKGKSYLVRPLTPADRPIHKGAPKGWKPTAYVTYWSARNGKRFGATRTAGPEAKPGTVGHALFHNALDHVNGTGA